MFFEKKSCTFAAYKSEGMRPMGVETGKRLVKLV